MINWNELLVYKEGILYWKYKQSNFVKEGDPAGSPNSSGHLQFVYKGKNYAVHRVIWEMFNGPIPDGLQIDHINRIKSDNRIENLRLANNSQNQQNKDMQKNNTSGYIGVGWHKLIKKFAARIRINGKLKHLGYFDDPKEAHLAYTEKAKEVFGEFYKGK